MAIDFGDKNTGLAVTDLSRTMVFGRGVLRGYRRLEDLFEQILGICRDEEVTEVIFGVPGGRFGEDTPQVERMRDIGGRLEEYLGDVPVVFQDESFSSFEADAAKMDSGLRKKYSQHELAAMVILERYLQKEAW
ncbi:RuvX/YqgF family protein [Patescibacteria group bacterium]|nr:RuvX/YqgF family protein [Patescibacteria group bacterium]